MTDREGFLTRWSRVKREADEIAPETAAPAPPPRDEVAPEPPADSCKSESPNEDVESQIAALPPIESITASTDIRAFLNPAIPAQLTRAALRRAWVADPAIRDFVGLSENAWDFNAPDAVPGFGSVLPSEQTQRMIAGMLGDDEPAPPSPASGEASEKPDVSVPQQSAQVSGSEAAARAPASDNAVADQNHSNAAPQEENLSDDNGKKIAHRHGRALPR